MTEKFKNPYVEGGDAFVLLHEDKYYLYCTRENDRDIDWSIGWLTDHDGKDGIEVHVSEDMEHWTNLGYCLEKGKNIIGDKWFWAPEVSYHNGKFYMVYAADEHLAIAVSDKPEGPFVQTTFEYLDTGRSIDGHLFFDDDGNIYLYYAALIPGMGNLVYMKKMKQDLSDAEPGKGIFLIKAKEQSWESEEGIAIAEGPFVLKHKGLYYLTYSANNVLSPNYAVGYAVSDSPYGPFQKYDGNPILIGDDKLKGYGHHSFVRDKNGDLVCVHHCHNPFSEKVKPRRVCFHMAKFIEDPNGGHDILRIE